ncbi:MAG TPA: hypothetical protein P5224_11730 [Mesotoga sp.]|nr:hypothetical protein [Mesotoga sp.]
MKLDEDTVSRGDGVLVGTDGEDKAVPSDLLGIRRKDDAVRGFL